MSTISWKKYIPFILLISLSVNSYSQTPKRICVMGSSTTYGFFGNPEQYPRDSAWAFKLKRHYMGLGIIDTLYNLGVNGADPYDGMPSSFTPPSGRDLPDPNHNITKALGFSPKPDILIVNFPTNHYDWLPFSEIISCLQVIKDSANAKGVQCYITTTQPRDNFSLTERQRLKDLKALIESTFGYWAIDFWTDVAVDSNLKILPVLAFGDQVHLNPTGHDLLYSKVVQKNIFFSALAAKFGSITAKRQDNRVLVNWQVFQESDNERFIIEKSINGNDFTNAGTVASRGNSSITQLYSFVDQESSNGNLYYRVAAVNHAGSLQYSPVAIVKTGEKDSRRDLIYPTITSDKLSVLLASDKQEIVQLIISDVQGKKVMSKKVVINYNQIYPVMVSRLSPGTYFLTIEYGGKKESHKFMKF